ncbi:MAG: hypothetical protein GTO51_04145 [Candidatus Latescibacteria bacterium]|nr:hypothetical protein [Candidatus Latescibacterota bacterium]NIM21031.1 hypothetical protein [Candidatus Latescibacterota bacterium]NIM65166.1 hypothetical protein [Candidatus Latescibacterota bacterium]NIO01681.1 hypothetical protein [Candidatus Latescibacterota bacterium]NIO28198.1 hypothetical protein [Candidatus Latescibacterota bacterium]
MMRQMRQNTKIILWIVVVSFVLTIFAVWGMDLRTGSSGQDPSILGRVNGVAITRAHYQAVYEQLASEYRALSPDGQLSYSQLDLIQKQTWDNIVIAILTDQQIEKLGITVTDEEILNFLRTTPPPEIQQYFMDEEGNFDYQAYQRALNNPEADWTSLENLARQRIPRLKLNQYLAVQVHVSNDEIRQAYEEEYTKITFQYVEIPIETEDVEGYEPTEEEIQTYYNEHLDEYTDDEKASLEIVKIDITPSPSDVDDILYTLGVIRSQILSGEEFATLAQTYSEAPTGKEGGATGWIGEGQRDPKVIETLASLDDGGISEPVEAADGYYILQRIEARTGEDGSSEFSANEIFIKLRAGSATTDSLLVLANDLQEKAQSVGLREAAKANNLEVLVPKPIYQNFPLEDIGFVPAINEFAFSNEKGSLSRVLRDETHYYICQLMDRIPATPKPIAEVREGISKTMANEHKKKIAWRKADGLHRQSGIIGFAAAAEAHNRESQTIDSLRVNDSGEPFGPRSAIAKTALSLNLREISPPIEWIGSYYVVQLMSRSAVDEDDFRKNAPTISNRLYQEKIQRYIAYWYENLEKSSNIEDYRSSLL